jgi:eukaryotic-like serine/threonine-protein kinase
VTDPLQKQAQARVGIQVRKWTIDRLLAIGGMASVYVATHRNGNRVAIKVLHREFADMPEAKERFMREGYVANKVGHPGAVTVLDDDQLDDGTPFLVMELLSGQSLEDRLGRRPILPLPEVLYVADQILDVLAMAHDAGIIHRDIKPPNVFLIPDGKVKVLDFGLARLLDPTSIALTRAGTVIGTASYMSPEQARGKHSQVDHRTDIFALGALVFRCLSGRTVHTGATATDCMLAAMSNKAPSLAEVTRGAPADVVSLVDRALAFDKTGRWPDARSMQADLRAVYQSFAGRPMPTPQQVGEVADWRPAAATPQADAGGGRSVSVVFDDEGKGDSIVVDLDEES